MTMGLRRIDLQNWLTIDKNYLKEHEIRKSLLETERNRVIQFLPGSEGPCVEVLEVVSQYLARHYPCLFRLSKGDKGQIITIANTGEAFQLIPPYGCISPLEIAARLSMEDLNVLTKDPRDGEYHLAASASFFPVGWNVSKRIGWSISQVHRPVPGWKPSIGQAVHNFFCQMRENKGLERSAYFVQVSPSEEPLLSKLFRPDELSDQTMPKVRDILIRKERQTFRRLPKSVSILFTVKTSLTPLREIDQEEKQNLAREIRSWPEDIAEYKGRGSWGACVLDFIDCGIDD